MGTIFKLCILILLINLASGSAGVSTKCDIKSTFVNCSYRHLSHIPSYLPPNITILQFNDNSLGNITNKTFVVVSYPRSCLRILNIEHNHIRYISKDAFTNLPCLKTLILDKNRVVKSSLMAAFYSFNHTQLQFLSLNNMSLGYIPYVFFHNLDGSNISTISMRVNDLRTFNMSVLRPLSKLRKLDISRNFIYRIEPCPDISLEILNLNFNLLALFSHSNTSNCPMPTIKTLYIVHNDIMYIYTTFFLCFSNVENINLTMNPIIKIYSHAFSLLPNLKQLILEDICGLSYIGKQAFSNNKLKYLSLKNNNIQFDDTFFSSDMFNGSNNLKTLDLSGNIMIKTPDSYLNSLFEPIKHVVQILHLSDNILRTFPKAISSFTKMTHLYIASNELSSLDREDLPPALFFINLYDNEITSVNEHSLPENLDDFVIDLGYNPFACTCELLWFLDIFTNGRFNRTFVKSKEEYVCASPSFQRGKNLTDFAKTIGWHSCLLATTTSLIILFASSFSVILIIVGSALYYCRWHLRYFLYLMRRQRLGQRPDVSAEFKYDAFVCYSKNDLQWVVGQAIPELEEHANIKLCIHQRDFELGAVEVDNIVCCVNDSRRFIIVLSDNFAQSRWCWFVLSIIQSQSVKPDYGNCMVFVKLDAINERNMTDYVFELLKSGQYIEYPDDPRVRNLFWDQLVQAVKPNAGAAAADPNSAEGSSSSHGE